jgi:hypothetical protein
MTGPAAFLISDWSLVPIMPMNSTGMNLIPSWKLRGIPY